jgi:membrane protein YdbS with pleckstrin-like domain
MYQLFRQQCEKVLQIPPEPEPPPGDEASTRLFRAAPNFFKYLVAIWALQTVAIVVGGIILAVVVSVGAINLRAEGMPGASLMFLIPVLELIVVFVGSAILLAIVRLDYEKRWYLVTDRSLRIREGVLKVREMTVTFANIQNISVSQGPLQRILGISDVVVQTAGGGGGTGGGGGSSHHPGQLGPNLHRALFRGIDNAAEVRQLIESRLKKIKDAGLGDHDDRAVEPAALPENTAVIEMLNQIHAEAAKLRQAVAAI